MTERLQTARFKQQKSPLIVSFFELVTFIPDEVSALSFDTTNVKTSHKK